MIAEKMFSCSLDEIRNDVSFRYAENNKNEVRLKIKKTMRYKIKYAEIRLKNEFFTRTI